jgi:hypothetical protein
MASINALQGNSALSQLLLLQQPTQASAARAKASQPSAADHLSLADAALQALQGLGLDSTQLHQAQTYTAKGHHHHHHGAAQAQQEISTQPGGESPTAIVPQVGQVESPLSQAKN